MYNEIIKKAFEASENSYSPYSNYKVGACVKTKDGNFFKGTNIENISYGLTNCAERNAIFAAYTAGYRKNDIDCIAIVADDDKLVTPCGACRQVLFELLTQETPVVLATKKQQMITNMKELMPFAFDSDMVKKGN